MQAVVTPEIAAVHHLSSLWVTHRISFLHMQTSADRKAGTSGDQDEVWGGIKLNCSHMRLPYSVGLLIYLSILYMAIISE